MEEKGDAEGSAPHIGTGPEACVAHAKATARPARAEARLGWRRLAGLAARCWAEMGCTGGGWAAWSRGERKRGVGREWGTRPREGFSPFLFFLFPKFEKDFEFEQLRAKIYEGYRILETNFSPNATSKHDANLFDLLKFI